MTFTSVARHAPAPVGGPAAWDDESLKLRSRWRLDLSDDAWQELLGAAQASTLPRSRLRCLPDAASVLPGLHAALATARDELQNGSGVVLIRGLRVAGLQIDVLERLYWLLGNLFGSGLAQNVRGELLGDVIDLSDRQESARPFQNGGGLVMHRDPVDIVGLLCVRHAKAGGQSRIVSAARIHDRLALERPDLLARLYEGYFYHRLDEDRGDAAEYTAARVPVFAPDALGRIAGFFIPGPIERAARRLEALDDLGREALARFIELTNEEGLFHDMTLQPGDVQFLNNRLVLHGRTDYTDHARIDRRRYMLRLWLAQPSWPAPFHTQRYFEHVDHFDRQARIRSCASFSGRQPPGSRG